MAIKTGSIYEQFLMECLVCAVRTLATLTGKPFVFWTAALMGQGSEAMKQRLGRRGPNGSDRQLEQIRALMAQQATLAEYQEESPLYDDTAA